MSKEHVCECHARIRHVLEHFHSFRLAVKDFSCTYFFEGYPVGAGTMNKLIYLEKDDSELTLTPAWFPQRNDYLSYFLELRIEDVCLTNLNPMRL
jgi:hypothetical protein